MYVGLWSVLGLLLGDDNSDKNTKFIIWKR